MEIGEAEIALLSVILYATHIMIQRSMNATQDKDGPCCLAVPLCGLQ